MANPQISVLEVNSAQNRALAFLICVNQVNLRHQRAIVLIMSM